MTLSRSEETGNDGGSAANIGMDCGCGDASADASLVEASCGDAPLPDVARGDVPAEDGALMDVPRGDVSAVGEALMDVLRGSDTFCDAPPVDFLGDPGGAMTSRRMWMTRLSETSRVAGRGEGGAAAPATTGSAGGGSPRARASSAATMDCTRVDGDSYPGADAERGAARAGAGAGAGGAAVAGRLLGAADDASLTPLHVAEGVPPTSPVASASGRMRSGRSDTGDDAAVAGTKPYRMAASWRATGAGRTVGFKRRRRRFGMPDVDAAAGGAAAVAVAVAVVGIISAAAAAAAVLAFSVAVLPTAGTPPPVVATVGNDGGAGDRGAPAKQRYSSTLRLRCTRVATPDVVGERARTATRRRGEAGGMVRWMAASIVCTTTGTDAGTAGGTTHASRDCSSDSASGDDGLSGMFTHVLSPDGGGDVAAGGGGSRGEVAAGGGGSRGEVATGGGGGRGDVATGGDRGGLPVASLPLLPPSTSAPSKRGASPTRPTAGGRAWAEGIVSAASRGGQKRSDGDATGASGEAVVDEEASASLPR